MTPTEPAPDPPEQPVHLRAAGVSLVLALPAGAVPAVLHWGVDLGDLRPEDLSALAEAHTPGISHSALDRPRWSSLVPEVVTGFTGIPALEGHRSGSSSGPAGPRLAGWRLEHEGGEAVRVSAEDPAAGWAVSVSLRLDAGGLLEARTRVANSGDTPLHLAGVRTVLPVPARATELLDLTGRWCRERDPQRHPWVQGVHLREGRHGRTGHDATLLMVAGTPGFGFSRGEVWGVHVAWSGDHATYAQRTPEGECLLGGGELLHPGEVVLEPGEEYVAPRLLGSFSGHGLDPLSHRLHDWLRARQPRTRTPRPVVVNTWEAAYFDHDMARLGRLAEAAADVGAERFVLDDGWFRGRSHDRAALGDWEVDREKWPDGLHPLVAKVQDLGMDFGLWVEPEMVNEDSDLARAHPDWVLAGRADLPPTWRHQQVLDLQVPGAYEHIRDALLRLLEEYEIAYLKWDHNRDLIDVAHEGRPAVRGQTAAFHRLLDELHAAHPGLEIESCASGGGRVDAEVLTRTDRIWPSDTIDALERQRIQTWTSLLVPPELIGSHLGGPVAHTTGRSHRLGFRAATAVLFSFGIEWDVSALDADDRDAVRRWVDLHKRIRPLLPSGRLVHGDHPDPAVVLTGVVAADRSEGWYVVATTTGAGTQHLAPVRLPGLDPAPTYLVTGEMPTADQHGLDLGDSWTRGEGLVLPGSVLDRVGVRLPVPAPETATVLHAVRT